MRGVVRRYGLIFLETDEQQEAVGALEMVLEQLSRVSADLYAWRWVVIALHVALQGSMVLALRGASMSSVAVWRKEYAKNWLEAHDRGAPPPPDPKLDRFLNLYKKIKSNKMMERLMGSRAFRPSGTEDQSVKRLNSLRNEFIHFQPQSWLLQVEGYLPPIVEDCVAIVEFLAFDCGNVPWGDLGLKARTRELLEEIRRKLDEAKSAYSSAAPSRGPD
jgi:hypothetical protein